MDDWDCRVAVGVVWLDRLSFCIPLWHGKYIELNDYSYATHVCVFLLVSHRHRVKMQVRAKYPEEVRLASFFFFSVFPQTHTQSPDSFFFLPAGHPTRTFPRLPPSLVHYKVLVEWIKDSKKAPRAQEGEEMKNRGSLLQPCLSCVLIP